MYSMTIEIANTGANHMHNNEGTMVEEDGKEQPPVDSGLQQSNAMIKNNSTPDASCGIPSPTSPIDGESTFTETAGAIPKPSSVGANDAGIEVEETKCQIDDENEAQDHGHGVIATVTDGGLAAVSVNLFETGSSTGSPQQGKEEEEKEEQEQEENQDKRTHDHQDYHSHNNKSSSTLEQESKSETVSSHPVNFSPSHISNESNDDNKFIFNNPNATSTSRDDYGDNDHVANEEGEEYEGGKYLLRHDIFLPTHLHHKSIQKYDGGAMSASTSFQKHQTLFNNLDRSFEKNLSVSTTESDSITICRSTQEIIEVIKMCFAAMAVVFSSHNPSVTTMAANNGSHDNSFVNLAAASKDLDECIVEKEFTIHSMNASNNHSNNNESASTSSSPNTSGSKISSSMVSRHQNMFSSTQEKSCNNNSNSKDNDNKTKMKISPSMASLLSGISDENLGNDPVGTNNNSDYDNESIPDTLLNENTSTEFIDNMEPVQRPSVPLTVVHMLWRQLIQCRFHMEKKSKVEKETDAIMKLVQFALVEELKLLEMVEYLTPLLENDSNADDSNEESASTAKVEGNNDKMEGNSSGNSENEDCIAVECIQVNHDIHLQYGRYIAKNCTEFFPFYLDKGSKKLKQQLLRTYDEETWNPEEALNAVMAKSCLKFFKQYSSKYSNGEKASSTEQLQFEYSIEMLPWHLMRAMLYRDVVDLLTDYLFVKSRMNVLEFKSAAQMHIADAEELHSCINTLMAKYPHVKIDIDVGQMLVQSYRLVGGVIHCEDSSKWQDDEDEVEKEQEQEVVERMDDNSPSGLKYALSFSKALQALGDSLSRYNLKSEAMKFYYRAMLKFESINSALSDQSGQSGEEGFKLDKITPSHSHLLMGGILSRIASVYEWQNNITDAMLCYERSLSFYSRHQSKHHFKGVAKVLASMGQLHFNMKEYEPALSCLRESLKMWKGMEDNVADEIANLLLLMGHVRREMGQLNEALGLFSEALYDKVNIFGKLHPEGKIGYKRSQVIMLCSCHYLHYISHFNCSSPLFKISTSL